MICQLHSRSLILALIFSLSSGAASCCRSRSAAGTRALALFAILLAATGSVGATTVAGRETLQIDDHRPLARAAYELRLRHGLFITYEDPHYVHESELIDITDDFPEAKERFQQLREPRLIAPGRGRLELTYPVEAGGVPADPAALLRELVDLHNAEGNPGRFEVRQEGEIFHLVPVAAMDQHGKSVAQQPLLDTAIVLPRQERSVEKALVAFVEALQGAAGAKISIGIMPRGLEQHSVDLGAGGEPAREILTRILAATGDRFTWGLYFDPMTSAYMLNVSLVRRTEP